jgi:hypothetical protein
MNSGRYAMKLNAGDCVAEGLLDLDGAMASSICPEVRIEGQISQAGKHLIGALTLEVPHCSIGNSLIGDLFAVPMIGSGTETHFTLHGLGPLGLIVELVCEWKEPLEASASSVAR